MKKPINSLSFLLTVVLLICISCQKRDIYADINNAEITKADPLIALGHMMDTPVVMGKVVLNEENQVTAGWIVNKDATLQRFQLNEETEFPTHLTPKSEFLLENILNKATVVKEVDATELMLKARELQEIGYVAPVYRSGEETGNSTIYFTFSVLSNTSCTVNNTPISFVTSIGCGPDVNPSSLQNCVSENSVSTMIIQVEGTVSAILPREYGVPLINYIDNLIGEEDVDSN